MSQFNYKDIIGGQLPGDLYKSRDLESQAIGNSLDKLQANVDMLEKDTNPLTAISKGLEQWERFFKLPSNIEENIETRRARVVSELIQFMSDENVIRKDEMESIVSLFVDEVEVVEHFADYLFDVICDSEEVIKIEEIVNVIKTIKPSWLDFKMIIKREKEINLNIAIIERNLKTLSFKPYSIEDVKIINPINIGISSRKAKLSNYTINTIEDIDVINPIFFVGICRGFKEIKMEVEHV